MSKAYRQGFFRPKNPSKYQGDPTNIIYRSSWERIMFSWLDLSRQCVSWSSEEFFIPYISPIDDKPHRYFVDVKATFIQTDGSKKTFIIEIKPYDQTLPPKNTKNKKTLMESVATYQVNQAKWAAAKNYCEQYGYEFKIVTEYDLGLKKR